MIFVHISIFILYSVQVLGVAAAAATFPGLGVRLISSILYFPFLSFVFLGLRF